MNKDALDKVMAASRGMFHSIIACAFGHERDSLPRFVGKGCMTSDDFIFCNFIGADGRGHLGAFVGSRQDFNRNVAGIAAHCELLPADRAVFFDVMNDWSGACEQSYRRVI